MQSPGLKEDAATISYTNIIAHAPVPTVLFKGRDLVIADVNDGMLEIWNRDRSIIGMTLLQMLPELEGQPFIGLLQNVWDTGNPFTAKGVTAKLERNGFLEERNFDIAYSALKDDTGTTIGVLAIGNDTTATTISHIGLEQTQQRFKTILELSPTALCLMTGANLVIEFANKAMLKAWGKDEEVIGQPFAVALPEMQEQPFIRMLKQVYETGVSLAGNAVHAQHEHNNVLVDSYYDFSYSAVNDINGNVDGVLVISHDVTEQVLARRGVSKAQGLIDTAVETAKLGTWELSLNEDKLTISDRVKDWFNFTDVKLGWEDLFNNASELEIAKEKLHNAIRLGTNGVFDMDFSIEQPGEHPKYGRIRGQVIADIDGKPFLMVGTIQDITVQRNTEIDLEAKVQERTEELASTNEELTASNEDLNQTNEQLTRSNEELTQYAYVASHDLQEPLRKIRLFSDMLMKQGESEKDKPMIGKINQAAQRMSILIQDLLKFSRLLDSQEIIEKVDLNNIIKDIVIDFELTIEQKDATIEVGKLPVIEGVKLHMNQLFYNLMSNAFKFTSPERKPLITISSKKVDKEEVQDLFNAPKYSDEYNCISFADNGIGFSEEYQEKVFEIFKRLHTREEYEGSGIGLALCKRIAANHGGHLAAHSAPDEGTTFYIYLPAS